MHLGVFERASLKAIGRDEDGLLSARGPHPIGEYLNILTLNRPQMVLALYEDEEVCAERAKPHGRIDFVAAIRSMKHFAMFDTKRRQVLTGFGQQIDNEPFERRPVYLGAMIRRRSDHF